MAPLNDSDRFSSRARKKNRPSRLSSKSSSRSKTQQDLPSNVKGGENIRKSGGRRSKRVIHDSGVRSSMSNATFSNCDLASPSSDVEAPSSGEKISKTNHTQATMDKYKELYLAILSDPSNAPLFQENNDEGEKPPSCHEPTPTTSTCAIVPSPEKSISFRGTPAGRTSPHDDVTTIITNSTSRPARDDVKDAPDKANDALSGSVASSPTLPPKNDAGSDGHPQRKLSVEIDQLQDLLTQSPPASPKLGESSLTEFANDAPVSSKKKKKKTTPASNRTPAPQSDRLLIRIIPSKDMKIQAGGSVSTRSVTSITSDLSELKPAKRSDVKRKEAERQNKRHSTDQKSRPRSQSPSRRSRRRSHSRSDDASVSSTRSSRSNRSTHSTSSHRSSSSRRSKRRPSSHEDENLSDDDDWPPSAKEMAPVEKKEKKGIFRKIKKFAGGVKKSLGLQGVHKFKIGEKARYKMSRVKHSLESFDPITQTAEVEILFIHIDAMLEVPYYSILFDDGSRKQTNWETLIPLADWNQNGKANFDSSTVQEKPRAGSRFRSWSRSRRISKTDLDEEVDDDKSVSSCRSSRSVKSTSRQYSHENDDASVSSHKSSSSQRSTRSSSSSRKKPRQRERSRSPIRKKSDNGRDSERRRSTKHKSSRSKTRERSPSPTKNTLGSDKEKRQPRRSKRHPSRS